MPGDYIFPKRRFKHGEPLDPDEVNEAIQPAAERLNGFLGPHNLRAPIDKTIAASAGTFYRTQQVFVDMDSGLEDLVQSPSIAPTDAFVVEQDTSWQRVEADTAGRDMALEVATGASTLSITAFATYCFHGYDGDGREVWALDLALPINDAYTAFFADRAGVTEIYVALEGPAPSTTATATQYHSVTVALPLPGNATQVREQLARQIAAAGDTGAGLPDVDYAAPTWAASGYSARAEGTKVLFTRLDAGPSPGGTFFWAKERSYINTDMTLVDPSVAGSGVAQKFSDLVSIQTSHSADGAMVYFPAQVQFALRVDGVVIPETITGRYDNEQGAFQPARIEDPVSTNVGLLVPRFKERPDALGVPMYTVRLTFDVDVRPGTHVVELVARRAPMAANRKFRLPSPTVGTRPDPPEIMPADSRVSVYSRQLRVLEVPQEPTAAARFEGEVTVPAYSYEDVVSHESLDDDRLRVVVDALNDVKDYQVARGAINGAHLADYSATLALAQGAFTSGGLQLNAAIDTYDYLTTNPATFGQYFILHEKTSGWKEVVSSKLTKAVSAGTIGAPNLCAISVEGNVFLDKLQTVTAATSVASAASERMHLGAAVFCIGLKSQGTWYLWMPSIAWVNSNHYWASQGTGSTSLSTVAHLSNYTDNNGYDYFDVPVTAEFLFNYDALGLLRKVDEVGIFGSCCRMKSTVTTTIANVRRASVNAVATKA